MKELRKRYLILYKYKRKEIKVTKITFKLKDVKGRSVHTEGMHSHY